MRIGQRTHPRRGRFQPRLTAVVALLVLSTASASAGTRFSLDIVGFSEDGRYLAYTESGILDMAGFEQTTFYVLEVPDNSFAVPPSTVTFSDPETEAADRAAMESERLALIERFGILPGNSGVLVFSPGVYDLVSQYPRDRRVEISLQRFAHVREELAVSIMPREVTGTDCNQFTDPDNPVIFRLDLVYANGSVRTLQDDSVLFASRRCPLDYAIGEIYYYRGQLVVFVNSFTFQLEGPDLRKLAVSGPAFR